MIEFKGEITGNCKQYIMKRETVISCFGFIVGAVVISIPIIILSITCNAYIWLMMLLPAATVIAGFIPSKAPNSEAAYQFLDYILDAENSAACTQYVGYYSTNTAGEELIPEPGDNVVLTLDIGLQAVTEQYLADFIESLENPAGGAAVVMDMTGGVLAMASYPTYDLATIYSDTALYNQLANDTVLTPLVNRATNGRYSPGSTFKPLVAIAALEEGLVTPTEEIQDTGRLELPEEEHYPYGDSHPQCWIYRQYGGTHGWENLAEALRDSCNIYFYTLGHRLGIDKIDEYAAAFGLGETTGFELSESAGLVAGPATSEALNQTWYGGEVLNAAIGQGNTLVTPLQLANYMATLLNGGDHLVPHLLKTVKSSDYSETVYEQEREVRNSLELDPANVDAVKQGMWAVANDPESTVDQYLSNLAVEVGAKTGSAQVGSAEREANAIFTLFAPYDDPEIVISIVVEGGASGGNLAQAAGEIVNYYFSAEHTVESVDAENTLLR